MNKIIIFSKPFAIMLALTISAPLALAPVVASAQQQGMGGGASSRGGETSPERNGDGPIRYVAEGETGIHRDHGAINHSICPPGSSLYWQIVTTPATLGNPATNAYLLGCD
jgi:hypothetical protein